MGDQVGNTVQGKLDFFPLEEFHRILSLGIDKKLQANLFSDMCRVNALYMIASAGSGHIGSSFSSMDIFTWLHLEELRKNSDGDFTDTFFSSKGHDAPGYYSVLMGLGRLDFSLIDKLRSIDGLPGHPDIEIPGVATNTGSLGMGISKAKGMILADRHRQQDRRIFVLTGDGELQEGQFWESLISAANFEMRELTVIIDHNKLQSDTYVAQVSDLGNLEAKLASFGWAVSRCNGNDLAEFEGTLDAVREDLRPKVIIADTIKGKGVSFMEHTSLDSDVELYAYHSGAPNADAYRQAVDEILMRIQRQSGKAKIQPLVIQSRKKKEIVAATSGKIHRLIPAYSKALISQAKKHPNLVALDADLVLDTGLIPFREEFPSRFIECGIAEQDMVSMAGGMALSGLLPVVHSFACFLSARPNEQIYNNATENTKIIYTGSLAGVLPGGPGHSHQAVRDISSLGGIPGITMMEPSCEEEVPMLLDWCISETEQSSYLRLISIPWPINFELPSNYRPETGKGVVINDGEGMAIIAAGPVMLSAAMGVAGDLADESGADLRVINLPWLNYVDEDWISSSMNGIKHLVVLDNHYLVGGQGDAVGRALHKAGCSTVKLTKLGLSKKPPAGKNEEVLEQVKLHQKSIRTILSSL